MRGKSLVLGGAALCILACLDREYQNPFLNDDSALEAGWELDRDRNGISDSVEFYAPNCEGTPGECLRIALDSAAIARERSGQGKTGADTSRGKPRDTVIVVKPGDTVVVVQPKDTVVAVTGIQAAAVYLPMGIAKVTPAVTVLPRDAKNKGYTLRSLNEAIVKVSGIDLVPVKPGTAKVRARTEEGGFTVEFDATVVQPDTNVYETAVAVAAMEFTEGDAARTPSVTWTPANTTNQGYSLVSGNPSAVQIVAAGGASLCRPVAPGQATVTLTTKGKGLTTTFKVTVKAAPILTVKVLSILAENLVLDKGDTGALPKVTLLPAGATDKSFTLSSSNPKVVSVTGTRINALSGGQARVTAASPDGPSAAFDVTVRVPLVSLSSPDLTLEVGAKSVPAVTFLPADADNKAYTLASSDPKIVSVNEDTLTAVKKGGADITITAADGAKTFRFKVNVEKTGQGEGRKDGEEDPVSGAVLP